MPIMPILALMILMLGPADDRAGGFTPDDGSLPEPPPSRFAGMPLEELCAEHRELSERLVTDYLAAQPGGELEALVEGRSEDEAIQAERKSFYEQVENQKRYNRTRAEIKQVVRELGTRECPLEPETFEPLIQKT